MCLRNIWMAPKAKMTDENDEETEEICEQGRTYVTRICEGKPSFDDGKYHNHCHQCPGFGMCIGDYRYVPNPLLICTRFLKNQFGKIKFDKLDFYSVWNSIFTACVACKINCEIDF